ncbi:MAG: nucleotide-binding protein [Caulobacteraceae bacterium]|nr:nucleotide-binding protein [Caulobacteraceae bacterium]
MSRAPQKPPSSRPALTPDQTRHVIARFNKRIEELKAFDPNIVQKRFGSPQLMPIEAAIDETLTAAFGHGTPEYNRYARAANLDHGPVTMSLMGGPSSESDPRVFRQFLEDGRQEAIALLTQAIRGLEEELPQIATDRQRQTDQAASRKVFVVHGHDEAAREAVARFLTVAGFEPIILHEQPNQGRTVIEKVVAHGDVGFAVVLLTPDDSGAAQGQPLQDRARQNVLLELGYFISRLGRERVCALKKGEMELPSDFGGVVYEPFDAAGAWRQSIAKELQAAGYEVDWNKIMR